MKRPKHPREKPVMVISDYPITSEIDSDIPYSAASNLTLLSDLHKVGIKQSDCYCTYLNYARPEKEDFDWHKQFRKHKNLEEGFIKVNQEKDLYISDYLNNELTALLNEIVLVKPKLIIITGKWSLYLLTFCVNYNKTQGSGKSQKPLGGISSYRASILKLYNGYSLPECIVMPILPAVTKQREPAKIPVMQWDYRKLGDIFKSVVVENESLDIWLKPKRESVIGTDFYLVEGKLTQLLRALEEPLLVSIDIETRHGTIDCIGFSWDKTEGIVIPFSTIDNPNPWTFEEELEITLLMLKVLNHKNLQIVGQNFSYDSQYLNKFYMINLHPYLDTMICSHVLYNYMEKNLAFLASLYCNTYSNWKNMQEHGKDNL
jgi:3'-5' exonuclease